MIPNHKPSVRFTISSFVKPLQKEPSEVQQKTTFSNFGIYFVREQQEIEQNYKLM